MNRIKWFTDKKPKQLVTQRIKDVDTLTLILELFLVKEVLDDDQIPELRKVVDIFVQIRNQIDEMDDVK